MLAAIGLAIGDLGSRPILAVLLRSLLVALLFFGALAGLAIWGLNGADPCALFSGETCRLAASASILSGLAVGLLALWFLFPAVSIGVTSAYLDRILHAVEARHYPEALAAARPLGFAGNVLLGLRSGARVLLFNLLALPFYLLLLVTGVGPLLLFVLVNGLALGRDYGEVTSGRHLAGDERRAWLATSRGPRTFLGMAITGLFLVPGLNLLAPVIGAAAAAHLFHRQRGR